MNIAAFIISIISLTTSTFIAILSLKQSNTQLHAENANLCNERYCRIISEIYLYIEEKNVKLFTQSINQLFDLWCYQFSLWEQNLLPNKIFLTWSYYNSLQLKNLKIDDTISLISIWNVVNESGKFIPNKFGSYMDCIINEQLEKIKRKTYNYNCYYYVKH